MNKPLVLILAGGLLLGLAGAGVYLYVSRAESRLPSSSATNNISPTPPPKLVLWDDPAGFTLEYPEGLTVDKHDEDKENYAHVEFSHPKHPGNIIVWVKDLPRGIGTTAAWAKQAATPSSALSFDTILGGKEAQKILSGNTKKTATVGVVYDGVLWLVEAQLLDESYWQSVYDTIVQSFVFTPLSTDQDAVPPAGFQEPGNDMAVDEEEVLE